MLLHAALADSNNGPVAFFTSRLSFLRGLLLYCRPPTHRYSIQCFIMLTSSPPIDLKEYDENSDEVFFKHPSTEYTTTSKHFEEHIGMQNQRKWKNEFFVDSVKSLPTVDSGDVIGWVAFPNESVEGSEHRSVDYMGKGEECPI